MQRSRSGLLVVLGLFAVACSHQPEIIKPAGSNTMSTVSAKAERTPQDSAAIWVELGQHYLELGRLDIAKEDLLKALKFDPKSVDARTVLATLYDRVGDRTAAEQNYREAVELKPTAGATNNNYGLYLCKLGKFDEAQKRFDVAKADGFYKSPDLVYLNSGTCILLAKGPVDKAEENFRRAVELNSKNPQALFQLASVLYDKGDYFKARAFIQRFDALGQPSPEALLLARNIELKLDNAGAARDYAKRLHEQFPDSAQTRSLDASTP